MILSFLRKKQKEEVLTPPPLYTDIHSHFIPGIDDGARTMEESLALLEGMQKLGYKKVITTPHIMSDAYRNTPQNILEGLKQLQQAAKNAGLSIEIDAAAEYYLDDGFYTHLNSGDLLTIAGQYLLVETSYISKPLQFDEMIFEISAAGYKPMLAHPERYRYIKNFKSKYEQMKEKGIYFQVNINSLTGHYGRDAKEKAEFLSEAGMIDFLGSDIHRLKQIEILDEVRRTKIYSMVFKKNTILNDSL